ncbi:hypothetical protein AYL99_06183 [Fonsecaea erecta]|uniref:DUF1917 domain-containing protein n=1 Tax=Fonsecaea erecta TaxID=1367422 RepID=A0A178ZHG3_9EURO|nr:hypothetical protein AYL99_06183 [Fonsecaea erecta]OAP58886.1 hypothetical protein AYL99_06183 [Fonsecaea erecta]
MPPSSLSSTASEASGPVMAGPYTSITDRDRDLDLDHEDGEDVFSDESDFHGSLKTTSTYRQLAAAYDPEKYWAVHEWNTQVAAARGRKARLEAAARQRSKVALKKNQQAQSTTGDGDTGAHHQQQTEGEIRGVFDKDGDGKRDMEMSVDDTDIIKADNGSAIPQEPDPEDDARKPQNYYEGVSSAKQLSESVADFLARLPPSTTTSVAAGGPWIWIANPDPGRRTSSDPEFGAGDVATFRQLGTRLLERYRSRKDAVEAQHPGKPAGTITRMLRPDRIKLESDVKELAAAQRVTAGKWMLFPREDQVDAVWAVVARAVWEGTLGTAAKVATARGGGETVVDRDDGGGAGGGGGAMKDSGLRLICIYTPDFSDQADVKRVLLGLKDLGLLDVDVDETKKPNDDNSNNNKGRLPSSSSSSSSPRGLKTIYYKCDAYTHLDLSSGNEFKLRASMYSSRDLFPEWYASNGPSSGGGAMGYR